MNALIKGEYDKLTEFQKSEFLRLVGWQSTTHKGTPIPMDDTAYFKLMDWVRKLPDPPVEPPKPQAEE